ncbi:branched-chain amino acid ABC transporter permease (plasmid) [Burkholderia sp. SFA1]|nr:branched-chain amino acid ABC transporter permease [Burkholderia sp. SFA1]
MINYLEFFFATGFIFAVISLGLNVQWGFTGLFNAGVAGFVAIGAYTSALLTSAPVAERVGGLGLPIMIGWIGAVVLSGIAATVIGFVTLRLREDYLAITTFGVAIVIQALLVNQQKLTGGPFGIGLIPKPFEHVASSAGELLMLNLVMLAAIVAVVYVAVETLASSPWGRVLRSIREDSVAAASLGKSVKRYELQAFVLGSMIMGLGGALQAHFIGFISPDNYLPLMTFQIWTMLIVGGSGNNRGAILGSLVVWGLWSGIGYALGHLIPAAQQARSAALTPILIGVALVLVLLRRPSGLLPEKRTVSKHISPTNVSGVDLASGVARH